MNNAKEEFNIKCLKNRHQAIQDFCEKNENHSSVQSLRDYYDSFFELLKLNKDSASLSKKIEVVVVNNYDLQILKFMQNNDKEEFPKALNALGDLYVEAYRNQANEEGFKFGLIVISGILAGFISCIIIEAAKQDGLVAVGIGVGCALIAAYLSYQQGFDYTQQKKQFMSKIRDDKSSKSIAKSFWGEDDLETTSVSANQGGINRTKQNLQAEFLTCVTQKDNVPS